MLLVCLIFIEFLFHERSYLPVNNSELLNQWEPYISFFSYSLDTGQLPLWSHQLNAGFPLCAFPHASLFYPPYLVFSFLDFVSGFTALVLIELILRALFMYALLREWRRSYFISWLGGAVFVFSGVSLHTPDFLPLFNTVTWYVGSFLFAVRLSRKGRTLDFVALVLTASLSYMGGDLELLVMGWPLMLVFVAMNEKPSMKILIIIGFALVVAMMICLAPFLFNLQFVKMSFRQAAEFDDARTMLKRLKMVLLVFVPGTPGSGSGNWSYLGALTLLGFVSLIGQQKERRLFATATILFVSLLVYVLNPWPLNHLFQMIPVVKMGSVDMRHKVFFVFLPVLFIAAAGGWQTLIKGRLKATGKAAAILVLSVFIIVQIIWVRFNYNFNEGFTVLAVSRVLLVILILIATTLMASRHYRNKSFKISPLLLVLFLLFDYGLFSVTTIERTDPEILNPTVRFPESVKPGPTDRIHFVSYLSQDRNMWRSVNADSGPGHIFAYIRYSLARHERILRELSKDAFNTFTPETVSPRSEAILNFLSVSHLVSSNMPVGLSREVNIDHPYYKSAYYENGHFEAKMPAVSEGWYKIKPGSYWSVLMECSPGDKLKMEISPAKDIRHLEIIIRETSSAEFGKKQPLVIGDADKGSRLITADLGLNGIEWKYILIRARDDSPGPIMFRNPVIRNSGKPFVKIAEGKNQLYHNPEALGRYGFYTSTLAVDDKRAFELLFQPDKFDPDDTILIQPEYKSMVNIKSHKTKREKGDVRVLSYENNRIILELNAPLPGLLSIAEQHFPGWHAYVNGAEVPVIRANYAYQAVPITKAGKHTVLLEYRPKELKVGLWAGLATISVIFTLMLSRLVLTKHDPGDSRIY